MSSPDFQLDAQVLKVDESVGLVMGWGIVCKEAGEAYVDRQDDHIPEQSMLEAACDFMQSGRPARAMHEGEPVGSIVFAWPMTTEVAKSFGWEAPERTGLMVAMKPEPGVLEKFRDGTFTGFSIGGRRLVDEIIEGDGEAATKRIVKYDESEARDEGGRWTSGGGGSERPAEHFVNHGLPKSPIGNKDPRDMKAGEINRELDKLDAHDRVIGDTMIAAGRGNETYSQSRAIAGAGDDLARARVDVADRQAALRDEIHSRYGPGAPSRLPGGRGFGPTRKGLAKYDDSQARDGSGRWSSGGGSSTATQEPHQAVRETAKSVRREGDDFHFEGAGGEHVATAAGHEELRDIMRNSGNGGATENVRELKSGQRYMLKAFGDQPRGKGKFMSGKVDAMQAEHERNEQKVADLHSEEGGRQKNAKEVARLVGRNAELRHLMGHARSEGY